MLCVPVANDTKFHDFRSMRQPFLYVIVQFVANTAVSIKLKLAIKKSCFYFKHEWINWLTTGFIQHNLILLIVFCFFF